MIRVDTSAYGTGAEWEHKLFAEMVAGTDEMFDWLATYLRRASVSAGDRS